MFVCPVFRQPDSRFLVVSSRYENALSIPNFDPTNTTRIVSDPLINFAIDPRSGALTAVQEFPCGGRAPRQFAFNRAGTMVTVGAQTDGRVALIRRDPASGRLVDFVGYANVAGQITATIFNE